MSRVRVWLVLALAMGGLIAPSPAWAGTSKVTYAPADRPGPVLHVPSPSLRSALRCTANVRNSHREPIVLLPGTTLTPHEFSWNYMPAFKARHWPFCTVTLPHHAMSDIQVAAEYAVYAIRTVHARSGRRVQIVGHSQGGMVPRWALRFWPATRAMVDDLVGLAPSNHGTYVANAVCTPGCAPAFFQQVFESPFIKALNSRQETFRGISYTDVYSTTVDEVVQPNLGPKGSSSLHTGGGRIANIALQDICPVHVADHIATGTSDPVAYALAMDALTHRGPADPARISRSVCGRPFMPAVDPVTFPTNETQILGVVADQVATYPHVAQPPPLKCYVYARGCPSGPR
ncbi:MAG: esterase/lipase family protein [Streptosporangiaceae bacterium]